MGTWGVSSNILRKVTGHRETAGTTPQTPFLELCPSPCLRCGLVGGRLGWGWGKRALRLSRRVLNIPEGLGGHSQGALPAARWLP